MEKLSSTPARRVRQRTVRVGQSAMEYEIPEVIPPDLERPNSHDVYLVDYRIWGVMQYTYRMCIERQFETWRTLQRLIDARCKALWTVLLINVRDFGPVWIKKNTLSTCSDTWAQVQISSVDKLDILFCVTVMTV